MDWLEQGPVDVIFVGSSHIYTGINPAQFSYPVVNLADSALNYEMAEILCHKYWDRVCQSKLVVIELEAVPVYQDTLARRNGDFRELYEWRLDAAELPLPTWQRCKAVLTQNAASLRFGRLWPTIIHARDSDDGRTGPGFHARTGTLNPAHKDAFFDELGTVFDDQIVSRNLAALQGLLSALNQAGVEWRMLMPPFLKDYWLHPSSASWQSYAERAIPVCIKLSPVSEACIIDCAKFQSDRSDCFADWTHLSAKGAYEFSGYLSELLFVP